MAERTILAYPDPRLRERSEPVEHFDTDFDRLVDDLLDTLYATSGIALSAPQIGVPLQVLVMDLSEDRSAPEIYANPELLGRTAWGLVEESCLSVPGLVANVVRATTILVEARDRDGQPVRKELSGMPAVCMQHEMDHLAGKLFVDKLSIFRRLFFRASVAWRGRQARLAGERAVA